jgi:hypothetical protein
MAPPLQQRWCHCPHEHGNLDAPEMKKFFRENPQVLVLLVISLVLGIGTFIAVIIALATAGSGKTTGEPSGVILAAHAARAAFALAGLA